MKNSMLAAVATVTMTLTLGASGSDFDKGWGKSVRTSVTRGEGSWTAEITIHLAEFKTLVPNVPTSFSRSRMVSGTTGSAFYV